MKKIMKDQNRENKKGTQQSSFLLFQNKKLLWLVVINL